MVFLFILPSALLRATLLFSYFNFYPAAVNVAFTLRLLKETWSDDLKNLESLKAVSLTKKIIGNVRFSTISVLVYLVGICIAMSLTIP